MPETTLQPAAAAGLDTVISEDAPTTNYATNTTISVSFASDGDNVDALFKFDLSTIAAGSIIQEATLKLYLISQTGGAGAMGTSYISRIKSGNSGWAEGSVTWNTVDGATAWAGSAGCETSGTDYDVDPLWSGDLNDFPISQFNDYNFDLGVFQKMIDLGNYGMKIWSGIRSPTVGRGVTFASSDNATAANRPKLYIRWLEPTGRLVEYTFDIWDPRAKLVDSKGAKVEPNEVRPDRWIQVTGIDLPRGKAYDSLIEDPTTSYIVGVSFNEGGVIIKTDRNQFSEIILQRLAGGSG